MACPNCSTLLQEKRGRLKLPLNGGKIALADSRYLSCSSCHEVIRRFDDARKLGDARLAAIGAGTAFSVRMKSVRFVSAGVLRRLTSHLQRTQPHAGRLADRHVDSSDRLAFPHDPLTGGNSALRRWRQAEPLRNQDDEGCGLGHIRCVSDRRGPKLRSFTTGQKDDASNTTRTGQSGKSQI